MNRQAPTVTRSGHMIWSVRQLLDARASKVSPMGYLGPQWPEVPASPDDSDAYQAENDDFHGSLLRRKA